MKAGHLVRRGLVHYWRTNVAVVLGVATAVAVLAGALLVGDSVRGSLRDLVLQRLGRADRVVLSSAFFREALAVDLEADQDFSAAFDGICPMIVTTALVTDQESGRRASRVQVYGVDDRFWRFHAVSGVSGPNGRDALLSRALAADIGAAAGGTVLVRVERPSAIPIESLHGRKDNLGRTLRLTVRAIVAPEDLGDFSLQPKQGDVRAVFVPLQRLQQDLDVGGRVNALLIGQPSTGGPKRAALEDLIRRRFALEDVGFTVRGVGSAATMDTPRTVIVESAAGLLDGPRAKAADAAAAAVAMSAQSVFTYLANTITGGDRQVPYSLVTAMDLRAVMPLEREGFSRAPSPLAPQPSAAPPIVLNDWTARDLAVKVGDAVTIEYYVWEDPGRLTTRSAAFRVAAVVPIAGATADRDLAPVYPGITEAKTLGAWDPPFPIDLHRVRRVDEDYWDTYRTTPKAFIPLEEGRRLWHSRFGDRSSVRVMPPAGVSIADARDRYVTSLRAKVDPFAMGLAVRDVRADGLAASRGATDFGEYFTYFSFFLVVSALMLAALFFRLGVEQRAREVGLLRAVGFTTARVRRLFSAEGAVLAASGSVLGAAGAVAYGAAMMAGLRTWWSGAVGTTALRLHVSPGSLSAGAAGALVAAVVCIWWTLRSLSRLSERSLLSGAGQPFPAFVSGSGKGARYARFAFAVLGVALLGASAAGAIDGTAGFFGAGTSLLAAGLCAVTFRLRQPPRSSLDPRGRRPLWRIGLRNAAERPGRSVLAIGVIAAATFILVAVDAFRREGPPATDRHSGVGGFSLLVDLQLPLVGDPNGRDGRETLGLNGADAITIEPFRVLAGDDASCLNLYEPKRPRILGAGRRFIDAGRFTFQQALASSDAERANPWLLLHRELGVDVVPVIADANSMTYVLHKKLGDDIIVAQGDRSVRLRLVAALSDSIFQGELLMADTGFVRLFPDEEGYRFLLVEIGAERASGAGLPADLSAEAQDAKAEARSARVAGPGQAGGDGHRVQEIAARIEESAADLGADAVETTARLAEFHAVENTYLSTFQTLGGLGLILGTVGLAAVLLRNVLERRQELALLGAVGYRRGHIFTIIVAENLLLLACGLTIGTASALVAIVPAAVERGGRLPAAGTGAWLLVAVFLAGLLSSILATRAALRTPLLAALRSE